MERDGLGSTFAVLTCFREIELRFENMVFPAVIQAAKYGINISGATLYCTHQPCVICAKIIINAGILRVVYKNGYPDEFSMQLFDEANVKVEKYEESKEKII